MTAPVPPHIPEYVFIRKKPAVWKVRPRAFCAQPRPETENDPDDGGIGCIQTECRRR